MTQRAMRDIYDDESLLCLTAVSGLFFDDSRSFLSVLALEFEHAKVFVKVTDDDSLRISKAFSPTEEFHSSDFVTLSPCAPWKDALGNHLMWSWVLTNQQGYDDGFQLEFANGVVIQLIALGGISVRAVSSEWMKQGAGDDETTSR